MENIQFDSGVRAFRVNGGGVLRFNPGDPNVYDRFLRAADQICALEKELISGASEAGDDAQRAVSLMAEADGKMKKMLSWVFGVENDFDALLGGVNLLAVAGNGERVITNLFHALQPILVEGAERCAQQKVEGALEKAHARRAAQ